MQKHKVVQKKQSHVTNQVSREYEYWKKHKAPRLGREAILA